MIENFDIDRTKQLLHLLFPTNKQTFKQMLDIFQEAFHYCFLHDSDQLQVTDLTFTANSAGSVGLKVFFGVQVDFFIFEGK